MLKFCQATNTLIGQVIVHISAGRNLAKSLVKVSPLGLARVQWKFYLLFICLNFIDFIIIALFFPETKCKLLYLFFFCS